MDAELNTPPQASGITPGSGRLKRLLVNLSMVVISSLVAIMLGEFAARLVLDPVDYLSPVLVRDEILGIRLPPGGSGHDEWGFRNRSVPGSADIVALGDSHTYGNCAKMAESWPHVLAGMTGKSVYNLGMGGYGPNQYSHLFQTKALGLKPSIIICGLYMGDDFDNAYRITYGLKHWSSMRREGLASADADIWDKDPSSQLSWHKRLRNWLSEHSLLYRLVIHGAFESIKGRYQIENTARLYESNTSLVLPEKNIQEAFSPTGLLRGLDQESPSVTEGMRLTLKLLEEMNAACARNHIRFIVAVIPTKESVFARYLEHNADLHLSGIIDKLLQNERLVRQQLFEQFNRAGIRYVDVLPALIAASASERIYTASGRDMHPNKNGYRVIAEAIAENLKNLSP